jgi:hypothetical protein
MEWKKAISLIWSEPVNSRKTMRPDLFLVCKWKDDDQLDLVLVCKWKDDDQLDLVLVLK